MAQRGWPRRRKCWPPMPLTDLCIRKAKTGLWRVKSGSKRQGWALAKATKAKDRTKSTGARSAKAREQLPEQNGTAFPARCGHTFGRYIASVLLLRGKSALCLLGMNRLPKQCDYRERAGARKMCEVNASSSTRIFGLPKKENALCDRRLSRQECFK